MEKKASENSKDNDDFVEEKKSLELEQWTFCFYTPACSIFVVDWKNLVNYELREMEKQQKCQVEKTDNKSDEDFLHHSQRHRRRRPNKEQPRASVKFISGR